MVTINFKLRLNLSLRHVWLAERPDPRHAFGLAAFYNCESLAKWPGFMRVGKRKLVVDLSQGIESVFGSLGTDARYKIRRAEREGVTCSINNNINSFAQFYDTFATSTNLPRIAPNHLNAYWPNLIVTNAWSDSELVSSHAWMISTLSRRASLLWAASKYHEISTSQERNKLARANLLHYLEDMKLAETVGCLEYDFGYFGTLSPRMEAVNRFKSQFPCVPRQISTYYSWPLGLLMAVRRLRVPE
jgi:hypothetical protein